MVASGAGQDETSKLSTQYRISNTGEQTVTCEIDGTNSKGVGMFQNKPFQRDKDRPFGTAQPKVCK